MQWNQTPTKESTGLSGWIKKFFFLFSSNRLLHLFWEKKKKFLPQNHATSEYLFTRQRGRVIPQEIFLTGTVYLEHGVRIDAEWVLDRNLFLIYIFYLRLKILLFFFFQCKILSWRNFIVHQNATFHTYKWYHRREKVTNSSRQREINGRIERNRKRGFSNYLQGFD